MTAHQPKPKLTITPGEPVTIALQYPQGKQVRSLIPGAPPQMYYSLMDGRGVYLPLEVGGMIDALHLKRGEPFTILKAGSRDWRINRVEQKRDFYPPLPEGMPNGPSSSPEWPVNGAGEDRAEVLGQCYQKAVEISLQAVEYAKSKSLMLAPTFEDVRCIAAVLMIGGRR